MPQVSHETRLGEDALKEIAREYFERTKTSSLIGEERGVPRQLVPRLARAGKALPSNASGPPGETERA